MIGRAVVTGGAGFIGSHLVDRLADEGAEVLVIDDLSTGRLEHLAQARRSKRVQFHQADIRAPEVIEAMVRFGPEVVYHLAAQASVSRSVDDPAADASINVVGSVNVLHGSVAAGVGRFVFASTGGALYGGSVKLPATERSGKHPESPYGVAKKVVDDYLRLYRTAYGLGYVNLAFANIYGPRQDADGEAGVVAIFARKMLDGVAPTIYGDGRQTRDFLYVEDAVDAFIRAAQRGNGRLLNIGTGRQTTIIDIYRKLADMTGLGADPVMEPARPGELRRSALDASAAEKHLGWRPFTPLASGLRLTVDWFRFHS